MTKRRTKQIAGGAMAVAALAGLTLVAAACESDDSTGSAGASSSTASDASGLPQGSEPFELDPAEFTAEINHPYWPMEPGTRWTYEETTEDGTTVEVVVVVTDRTKEIANGITARVVRDTVTEDGEVVEDTFDWYAQDRDGNIWYLGEDTAEFENGEITSREGSWEAGVDGALAGIALPANAQPGMAYRQEYYAGKAEDNGEVLAIDEKVEVTYGSFDDLLLTEDTNAIEPDVVEHKFYARGVGPVLTLDVSGGAGREELVSVDEAPAGAGTGPLGSP
jgi:hypothetical protein